MNFNDFMHFFLSLKNPTPPQAGTDPRQLARFRYDYGQEMVLECVVETLTIAGGTVNFTNSLPAGAMVLLARRHNVGAVTLTTAVKLGIGVSGSPSVYLLSSTTMTDGAGDTGDAPPAIQAPLAAATQLVLTACATGGTAAGTAAGTVKVAVFYLRTQPIVVTPAAGAVV